MDYEKLLNDLRQSFNEGAIRSVASRRKQLEALRALIVENEGDICEAVYKDLHRPKFETITFETSFVLEEITRTLAEFEGWMKPTKVSRNLMQFSDAAFLQKDPLGVVFVIGTWNFPIHLLLLPLVGALAAGNCVVLKPCCLTANTEAIMCKLIPKYLDPKVCCAIAGDFDEITKLLTYRFDHIFFTGSPTTGKIIMRAAAEHLTPVTLELGGKNPAIIDEGVDFDAVARRILWGKMPNNGQICLAVDYVICINKQKEQLIQRLIANLKEFYGENPKQSTDYCRILNERNFDRLEKILQTTKANKVLSSQMDREDLYIPPHILDNVQEDDPVMQEEIFGPILPIMSVNTIDDAIAYIIKHEKPLTVYMFSSNQANINRVLNETSSGSMVINDVLMHTLLETLPFGGVGSSGMGRYHGKYTFDCFTHEKSVLHRPAGLEMLLWARYPPYSEKKLNWLKKLIMKWRIPMT